VEAKNVVLRRRRYICRSWRDWACSSTAINRSWWRSSIHLSIRLVFRTTLTTLGCPGCQTTISRSAKCISRRAELRRGNITTSLRPRLIVGLVFAFLPRNSVETSFEMLRCIPIDESRESIWYWVDTYSSRFYRDLNKELLHFFVFGYDQNSVFFAL